MFVRFKRLDRASIMPKRHEMRSRWGYLADEIYAVEARRQFDLNGRMLAAKDHESPFKMFGTGNHQIRRGARVGKKYEKVGIQMAKREKRSSSIDRSVGRSFDLINRIGQSVK